MKEIEFKTNEFKPLFTEDEFSILGPPDRLERGENVHIREVIGRSHIQSSGRSIIGKVIRVMPGVDQILNRSAYVIKVEQRIHG